MLGWGKLVLLACAGALLFGNGEAVAQVPCTTGTNSYTAETSYSCSVSGEVANKPILIDCRDGQFQPIDPYDSGCRVSFGADTVDVQRCTETTVPYHSNGFCRTALMDAGYTCTYTFDSEIYTTVEHRTCTARVFKLGSGLESTCQEQRVQGRFEERFTDSCTTKVTTPLARVTCTHDPGVRLAFFFDMTRSPVLDDQADTPACAQA